MYLDYYGFKETPFSLSPNPRYIYFSKPHKEVFALLLYGIDRHYGFIQLTGEVGTGKTTVLRTLLSHLDEEKYRTALIFNPLLSAVDLLSAINQEYGIASEADNCAELLAVLNLFLLEESGAGRTVVLIIDEAQNLSPELLEQVRLISNLETDSDKLIQIVLAGQPELADLLDRPELRQINQRIALRYHLRPLDREDSEGYIDHRLSMAGGRGGVTFSRWALRWLYHYSNGTPRLINILCDRALLVAYTMERRKITARTVALAFRDVMLKPAIGFLPVIGKRGLMVSVALLMITAAAFILYRSPILPIGGQEGKIVESLPALGGNENGNTGSKGTSTDIPAISVKEPVIPSDSLPTPTPFESGGDKKRVEEAAAVEKRSEKVPLTAEKPPEKRTVDEEPGIAVVGGEKKSAIQAFNAVASLIQASPIVRLTDRGPLAGQLKSEAAKRGLEMDGFKGPLEELARSGAPAILELRPKGSRRGYLVALTGARNERLSVHPPYNGRSVYSSSELKGQWSGQAYIIWRNWEKIRVPLKPGDAGNDVIRLQILLQAAAAPDLEVNGLYGDETSGAVKEFQKVKGMGQSGKVGPMTLMMLYRAVRGKPSIDRSISAQGEGR